MNIFLANVGNRDVWLNTGGGCYAFSKNRDGAEMAKYLGCREGTRYLSRHIRDNIDTFKSSLRFPLLVPAITCALRKIGVIDRLVLFATDQPPKEEPHRDWDTIESAELLSVCLLEHFLDKIREIKVCAVGIDPSKHDLAFELLGSALPNLIPETTEVIFASIKGGIPAMNAALRERVVHRYGKRAWLVETDEPPEGKKWEGIQGDARLIHSWAFRCDAVVRVLNELLERFDYAGALRLLELEGVELPKVMLYLKHALARLNLDFKGAAAYLNGMSGTPQQWQILGKKAWELQRLADVAYTAQNALEREDYGVFLSRVATFRENCLRLLCWALTNLQASSGIITFREIKDTNRELATFVRDNMDAFEGDGDLSKYRVDRKFFNSVIRWADTSGITNDVQKDLERFLDLEDLRNKFEHRMDGVSRGDVEGILPNPSEALEQLTQDILNKLSSVKRKTGKGDSPVRNVYREINDVVLQEVGSWRPEGGLA